jgi:hypothetical protein
MRSNLTKPCTECPFRRKHPAGWLGPWKAEEIPTHLSFGGTFPCHKTIPDDGLGENSPKADRMEHCAGASIFLNNKVERHRDADTLAHQELVGEDHKNVFSWTSEFLAHHQS